MPGALLTDLYELTMLAAYLRRGMTDAATFSLFARSLPPGRGYLVVAGLEPALEALEALSFDDADLAWCRDGLGLDGATVDAFARLRFTGDVWAVPEGRVVLAGEPWLEVTGPLPEAQLVETLLLNRVTFPTAVASKAARCVEAAEGRPLADFAMRRTPSIDAADAVARSTTMVGFESTSNVDAARRHGLATTGTMAHSFVQAFGSEAGAFTGYAEDFPSRSTFLVDTYDTERGVRAAIEVIRAKGLGDVAAIRLDSGDLGALARRARALLDDAGLPRVRIVASGGLDEFGIDELVRGGAPVDAFGVGTQVGMVADSPVIDTVYKLVDLAGRPIAKQSTGKATLPGAKQVVRGGGGADVLALREEPVPAGSDALLIPVIRGGRRLDDRPDPAPAAARRRFEADREWLPPTARRLIDPIGPEPRVTDALAALTESVPRLTAAAERPTTDRAVRWSPALIALVAYVPLLLTRPGLIGADTKQYLYLDPGTLLHRAVSMWDPNVGMGTVTHENIGYLWPMAPFYRVAAAVGLPMWVAQRLWIGSLLLLAGLGVRYLLRVLGWHTWPLVVASLAYMLTPYVLQYEARISAILMAWAGLPWMLGLTIMALRRGGWRYPALFALVAATCGSVNATSLIYAGLAPVLWIVFAVFVHRDTPSRHGLVTAARIGGLTLLASAWWIAGLATQAGYGLNVLRYTETVEVVARTGLPYEALRGLGNWFFYGRDAVNAWVQPAAQYAQDWWLLAVSFAVPIVAFGGAVISRWRDRVYFVALVLIGVALAVGVHPYEHPAPLGAAFKAVATSSTAGLALRSTGRAVPLVVLGTAVLLGAGLEALRRRWTRAATVAGGLAVVLIAVNMVPLFTGEFVDVNLNRPEDIPTYWRQAAGWLDSQGHATRVLELPGADFSHYRWGATLDPVTPGLMDRPFVGRELQPYGSPASTDLLIALDRRMQEGVFEPSSLAPVARLMGVGDVVLRSDLQYERFRSPRPKPTWQLFSPAPAGLAAPTTFGPPYPSAPTVIPLVDETTLSTAPGDPDPPAVAAYPVESALPIVRAELADRPLVIAGSGEGLVDAAGAGLVRRGQPVLYAAALDMDPRAWSQALAAGADLVLTDSNRRRAMRWGTIRENGGYTEQAGEKPLVTDPTDARLPLFPGTGDDAMTVAQHRGVAGVSATRYGNPVSYAPGDRPVLALDGDVTTAWKVGAFDAVKGEKLRIDLTGAVTTDRVRLVQPLAGPADRFITRTTLRFDGGGGVTVNLGPESRTPAGQLVTFPSRTFRRLELVIDADSVGRRADYRGTSGVGFAEVSIGDGTVPGAPLRVDEVIRLPRDLLTHGTGVASRFIVLLSRQRSDPLESFKTDEEQALVRSFDVPAPREFSISGTARVSAYAPDDLVDALLGRPGTGITVTSSSRLPGDLAARPQAALDGDPATAWQSAFGDPVGQWIELRAGPAPMTFDRLALSVLNDGQHSVPTKVRLVPDGAPPVTLDVPATGPLTFPAITTNKLRVEIAAARQVTTINYFSKTPVPLPVGIAELGIPGVTLPAPSGVFDTGCRSDVLAVDGKPVALRVQGRTADAGQRLGLTFEPCGPPLALGPGPHLVRAAPGRLTGIDVDRLVLGSERGGGPLVAASSTPSPMPPVTVVKQGRSWMDLRVDAPGQPFWLVLGESLNQGWAARADGIGDLGKPQLVDGYANGWVVTPKSAGPITVHLRWTPQSRVDIGLWLSALGALACLALAVLDPRRRTSVEKATVTVAYSPIVELVSPLVPAGGPLSRRRSVGLGVAIVVGSVLLAGVWGIVAGVLAAVALARPRLRWLLTGGAIASFGAAALYVVQLELRFGFPVKLEWPQHFEKVAGLAWLGVLLLAADAVIGYARGRDDSASSASA